MVRERPAGDPAQGPEARRVSVGAGKWNEFAANPIILSLSKDQRRKAKAGEAANEAGAAEAEVGEPDMFGAAGSVAAE